MKPGIFFILLCFSTGALGQVSNCSEDVPSYVVDLSGDPDSLYVSPHESRDGLCCDVFWPDRCVEFFITLDEAAIAINFEILVGAEPPGALFYQINCGPEIPVGQPICLEGQGPHILTFCKPGNNPNTYGITSIPGIILPETTLVRTTCESILSVSGVLDSTIVWNDVTSGTGMYNGYLSCTMGCDTVVISPDQFAPEFIDYEVCGLVVSELCESLDLMLCDTLRVQVLPLVEVNILPDIPIFCSDDIAFDLYTELNPPENNLLLIWTNGPDGSGSILGFGDTLHVTQQGYYSVMVQDTAFADCYLDTATIEIFLYELTLDLDQLPISCFGENDGVALATPLGGNPPYTYNWSTGDNSQIVVDLSPGIHTVTVTDQNGCEAIDQVNIAEPAALIAGVPIISGVTCNNSEDGIISISASGGTPPYEFLWSNGSTAMTITGLSIQTYSVIITDAHNCTTTAFAEIPPPNDQVVILLNSTISSSCQKCNGAINVSAFQGTLPYTFLWSDGSNQEDRTGLCSGSFEVTVTDGNGCQDVLSIELESDGNLVLLFSEVDQNVLCHGDNSGQATSVASGGTPPYSFEWDNGETSNTATLLDAGIHIISVTDAMGCQETDQVMILEPPGLNGQVFTAFPITCFGESNGIAAAVGSGGIPPYTYTWSNGINNQISTGLSEGNYTVTITDQNNCETSVQINMTAPEELIASSPLVTPLTCPGSDDGTITISVSGGTPPYDYLWSNGMTGSSISGLAAQVYALTITDANNCTTETEAEILPHDNPVQITLVSATTPICGNCNGGVDISVTQGTPPYTYAWSNGNTDEDLSGVCSGNYEVSVTDSDGCQEFLQVEIEVEEDLLMLAAEVVQHVICHSTNTGQASSVASGGAPPYAYEWDNGETSGIATQLNAGFHFVTVTDALGCQNTDAVLILEPLEITGQVSTVFPISCFGESNGILSASASGGVPPYSFSWSNGLTGQIAANLGQGTYQVTIADQNGCEAMVQANLIFPDELVTGIPVTTPITCPESADGTISILGLGGTPPYSYLWSNGMTGSVIIGLEPEVYALTITDANNCTAETEAEILPHDNPIEVVLNSTTISSCNNCNGSVDISIIQGAPPYTFLWNNGSTVEDLSGICSGVFQVTVTDSDGCEDFLSAEVGNEANLILIFSDVEDDINCIGNCSGQATATGVNGLPPYQYLWPDGQTTSFVSGLCAGTYVVSVSDINGCIAAGQLDIEQAEVATVIGPTVIHPSCFGESTGSASVSASGGTLPYSFLWDNGETSSIASQLDGGIHYVSVTDALGCEGTDSVLILEPQELTGQAYGIIQESCFDEHNGIAVADATGGVLPYTFLWSNGTTDQFSTGLSEGIYLVTISDQNGCESTAQTSITAPPELIAGMAIISPLTCFDSADGSISISVSGGTPPYYYLWSNGMAGSSISGLEAEVYALTISDANNCSIETEAEILPHENPIEITLDSTANSYCGNCIGIIDISVTQGIPPFTFLWNDGSTQEDRTGLCSGFYEVTVTDASGCQAIRSQEIEHTENMILLSSEADQNVICNGESSGQASAIAMDGSPPYSFEWDNGETSGIASQLNAGIHHVTVTDGNGCQNVDSVLIFEPPQLTGVIVVVDDVACFGQSEGAAVAIATGGSAPYTFSWSHGSQSPDVTGLFAGIYMLTITDANGCMDTEELIIAQPEPLSLEIQMLEDISCDGFFDGMAEVMAAGGTAPYAFVWSDGTTDNINGSLDEGTHEVTVIDGNGCSEAISILLEAPDPIVISLESEPITCSGAEDGVITITASGGQNSFNYILNGQAPQDSEEFHDLAAGTYLIFVIDDQGCSAVQEITIQEGPSLFLDVMPDTTYIELGEIVQIQSVTNGSLPISYLWDQSTWLDCFDCPEPVSSPLESVVHTLVIEDDNGCLATEDVHIFVNNEIDVFIPNAFTPNGDGINETFTVYTGGNGVNVKILRIFDRWGELVFENENFPPNLAVHGWDGMFRGKAMNPAVFVYYLSLELLDGSTVFYEGDVTLVK